RALSNQSEGATKMRKHLHMFAAVAAFCPLITIAPLTAAPDDADVVTFKMVVSAGAKACLLPGASATVTIKPQGPVEIMDVSVQDLPPNTEFDLFVIQIPVGPFGVSW